MHTTADDQAAGITCESPVVSVNGQPILLLPAEASAALPSRGQVAVLGSIEGHEFQTVVEPDGTRRGHWIRIDARIPGGDRLTPGESVNVTLSPAGQWPEPDVPDDLRSALDAAPDIADLWSSITPMSRWEWVRWVRATRNPATRARRVDASISKLRSGKRRPCCFDLSACTDPELSKRGRLMDRDHGT